MKAYGDNITGLAGMVAYNLLLSLLPLALLALFIASQVLKSHSIERSVLDGMHTLLAGWGCDVIKATDLAGAQQALRASQARPAGLLIDYHLDSGNGLDVVAELRRRLGEVPAILVTADRSARVRSAAHAHNVRVLHKPVKPASLRALLAQWRMQVAAE